MPASWNAFVEFDSPCFKLIFYILSLIWIHNFRLSFILNIV